MNINVIFTLVLSNLLVTTVSSAMAPEEGQKLRMTQLPASTTFPPPGSKEARQSAVHQHFISILRSGDVTLTDIAEALFVQKRTIFNFIKSGDNGEYVVSQFVTHTREYGRDLSTQKKEADKTPLSNYDEIESCLLQATTTFSIMPSKLREEKTLKTYFETLLNRNPENVRICDETLRLDGNLSLFLSGDSDNNLTNTVYTHLLSYYRGTRLILEDKFKPLQDVIEAKRQPFWGLLCRLGFTHDSHKKEVQKQKAF